MTFAAAALDEVIAEHVSRAVALL